MKGHNQEEQSENQSLEKINVVTSELLEEPRSEAEETTCQFRAPALAEKGFQHPHNGSQLPVTSVQEDAAPSSGL